MNLNSLLSGATKKSGKGNSANLNNPNNTEDEDSNYNESVQTSLNQIDTTQSVSSSQAKVGYSSEISISEPSYNYVYGEDKLSFECGRLDNISEETTGTLYLTCWVSEKGRLNGEWQNDNYALVDSIELGCLESGYGFPDLNITFQLTDELQEFIDSCFEEGAELHFVFTVNELHEDGNKYIIYEVNGPNENEEESEETTDDEESDVASIVRSIIVDKLGVDECDAVDEAYFMNDLGADSLDAVELIMEFENEFGITIPDDDAMRIKTVGQAIRYIEQHL